MIFKGSLRKLAHMVWQLLLKVVELFCISLSALSVFYMNLLTNEEQTPGYAAAAFVLIQFSRDDDDDDDHVNVFMGLSLSFTIV